MRAGGLIVIALAVTALLHRRRKPLEDARDERGDGDCFPHLLCSVDLIPLRPADCRGARTCVPALYSDIEQDGWITVTPIINEERN